MPLAAAGISLALLSRVAAVAAVALALGVVLRLARDRGVCDRLRRRFVLGVPWGTLVVGLSLVGVYLFVQGAWRHPEHPLVYAFPAWSYRYPLGMLASTFTHTSVGHLANNLLATVVFAPIAEYVWGHYPGRTGADGGQSDAADRSRTSRVVRTVRDRPAGRIVAFLLAVVAVGVFESLFIPGPVIGFSGVVFALGAFVVVTAPVAAVFALAASVVVRLTYRALRAPVLEATARPTFWTPPWADVSVQGHAMGLLLGVLLGSVLLRRREARADPWAVWFAVLVFAAWYSLWAIYWQQGQQTYVLYRGLGLAVVVILATVATVAVVDRDAATPDPGEPPSDRGEPTSDPGETTPDPGKTMPDPGEPNPDRHARDGTRGRRVQLERLAVSRLPVSRGDVTPARAGVWLLVACVLAIALVAVPYNAIALNAADAPAGGVAVGDYVVGYGENVTDRYVAAAAVPGLSEQVSVTTGGVILASPERHAWHRVSAPDELAHEGEVHVTLGGLGWRETVVVDRTNWNVHGDEAVYRVTVQRPDREPAPVYASDPITSHAVVDGRSVRLDADDEGFLVTVLRDGSPAGSVRMPGPGESVAVAGLTLVRRGDRLFVERGETRVRLATREDRLEADLG